MVRNTSGIASPQMGPHESGMYRRCEYWLLYTEEEQRAVAALLLPSYAAKATDKKKFAAKRQLALDSDEFKAAWQAQMDEWAQLLRRSYADLAIVYTAFWAVPGAPPIALATAMVEFGSRNEPFGGAVGANDSTIQTLRLLTGFSFGSMPGLDPATTLEREVAEMGRVCVMADHLLEELETDQVITRACREYIHQKGSRLVIAGAHFGALAHAGAEVPRRRLACYIVTMVLPLAEHVRSMGLKLQPLYLETGTEPTARAVNGPELVSAYFTWHLPPIVPVGMSIAQAVQFLSTRHPEVLRRLPWSLPFILPNDEALQHDMQALWDASSLGQDPPGEARLAAAD